MTLIQHINTCTTIALISKIRNLPDKGKVKRQHLKGEGNNPKLYTNTSRVIARNQLTAGNGITPFSCSGDQVIIDVPYREEANIPVVQSIKKCNIFEKGIKNKPLNKNRSNVQGSETQGDCHHNSIRIVAERRVLETGVRIP
jgi:hypothetical protein